VFIRAFTDRRRGLVVGAMLIAGSGCATPKVESPVTQAPPPPPPAEAPAPPPSPPAPVPPQVPGVRLIQSRAAAVAAVGYRGEPDTFTKIEQPTIRPSTATPGATLSFTARYTVLSADDRAVPIIRETRTLVYGGERLLDLPSRDVPFAQGTSSVEFDIAIPPDAAEGEYRLDVTLSAGGDKPAAKATVAFVLSVPRPAPAPTPPARVIIKHAFVTAASVDLRDGPGPEFKALARIFKGMPVDVLEVTSTTEGRWYRVQLITGNEGWVPETATGAKP